MESPHVDKRVMDGGKRIADPARDAVARPARDELARPKRTEIAQPSERRTRERE